MDANGSTTVTDQLKSATRMRVWDLPVRVFHWALVISFVTASVLSESERSRQIHVMFGYTVLGLVAFRLLWGLVGTRYARFTSFLYGPRAVLRYLSAVARREPERHVGHNPAASWAVYSILALGAATGIPGYCTLNEIGGETVAELHELMANAWLVVVVVHVIGVITASIMHRENLAGAMVTGFKRGQAVPGDAPDGSPSRTLVGVLGAAAVLAFWIGSLLTGDGLAGDAQASQDAQAALAQGRDADDD